MKYFIKDAKGIYHQVSQKRVLKDLEIRDSVIIVSNQYNFIIADLCLV
jgi:hypothetical protein